MKVYVRRIATDEIVETIEVGQPSARNHEHMMMGLLRIMDTGQFYADDSEVTLPEQERVDGPTT